MELPVPVSQSQNNALLQFPGPPFWLGLEYGKTSRLKNFDNLILASSKWKNVYSNAKENFDKSLGTTSVLQVSILL